ncbi:MAG: DUF2516 family protein [Demequina sp.]|jgi:hypothetical protein|nr:DUF2516 family protein [Demequina sp.]
MFGLQLTIVVIIAIVVFVAAAWALIQAFRFPADAYVAAGKRTRTFWLAITGVATLFAFLCLPPASGFNVFFLLETAAAAATLIFFVDVLPRLREVHRPGQSRSRDNNRGGW